MDYRKQKLESVAFICARLVAALLLIWALSRHPYSYYIMLRFVVTGVSAYGLYSAIQAKRAGWIWTFGSLVILFNPLFIVALDRRTWTLIDIGVAILFLVSIFSYRIETVTDKERT